jgi:hypothetical protein
MWNDAKQQQLNELRDREQEGTLTKVERETLEQLHHELEQEEWDALRPAIERLRTEQKNLYEECGRLRVRNAVLAALAERQEDLLSRGRVQLADLLSEHEALKAEYERVTGQPLVQSSF